MGWQAMKTIMVVDDQASNRRVLSRLASTVEQGVVVKAFGNPLDALAYADGHTPDLLITDYKMQPFDGDEFIRRFRRVHHCADVPAVVITAFQDVEFRDRAMEAGSTDFLLSPINHQDFVTRSRSLLAMAEQRKLGTVSSPDSVVSEQVEMMNDMLQTVNAHLSSTLSDLEDVKSDLENLVEITKAAVIFINGNLTVRRFTAPAAAIYRLTSADIGRPLTAIPSDVDYSRLEADFSRVAETAEITERVVATLNGRSHYLMRMVPYRRPDGSTEGAAIVFQLLTYDESIPKMGDRSTRH
jgi:CheY-like chemotaxis protein